MLRSGNEIFAGVIGEPARRIDVRLTPAHEEAGGADTMPTMIAARLHEYGKPMTLDRIEVPQPRPTDVLVEVKACGVVPNLARVVSNFFGTLTPDNKMMPPLPAIFGLDPAGVVAKVGEQVWHVRPGERVYVNPGRSCGSCRMCRSGAASTIVRTGLLQGYFGRSQEIMRAYPYGGLSQFITAPATALVKLPDNVSFEAGARFGYFGTAYAAMKKIGVGPGQRAAHQRHQRAARAQRRVAGAGDGCDENSRHRANQKLLDRVKALAPGRIEVLSVPNAPSQPSPQAGEGRVGRVPRQSRSAGSVGEEPHGRPRCRRHDRLPAARRAGERDATRAVLPAARRPRGECRRRHGDAADQRLLDDDQPIGLQGSVWFTTGEGEDMAAMVGGRHARSLSVASTACRRCPRSTTCSPAWTTATAASPIS